MSELFTAKELEDYLRTEVELAGGAKKWCKKHKIGMDHALHMITNGDAATLDSVRDALGFRKVIRYKSIKS